MKNLSDYRLVRALENYRVVGECYFYQGHRNPSNYAYLMIRDKNKKLVSYRLNRVVLALKLGKTYEELTNALHKCNNQPCIREEHLYEGSPKDNTRDGILDGTHVSLLNKLKRYCIHGHEFTPENTYIRKSGRECRVCRNKIKLKSYHKTKAWLIR